MKHLTVDEMIDFVSLTQLDSSTLMLAATVNEHIRTCQQCLKRVQAFQLIHDEFTKIVTCGDFKMYYHESVAGDLHPETYCEGADLRTTTAR